MSRPEDSYDVFVGIDWAREEHRAVAVDKDGQLMGERRVRHTGPGIRGFGEWVASLTEDPTRVAVGIEVPRGALIDHLSGRGADVYALNPKQLDRFRDRHSPSGAKDDRLDAYVLADSLRTDIQCFRLVETENPEIVHLREWTRIRENLSKERRRLANQLSEQLVRYFPQVLELASSPDEWWVLDLLERASTPDDASHLSVREIRSVLKHRRIRRLNAEEVSAKLREESLPVRPATVRAAAAHVRLILPRLKLVRSQLTTTETEISRSLEGPLCSEPSSSDPQKCGEHRDIDILLSLPGVGKIVASTVLAEAWAPLRDRDYHSLRAQGGAAPVTRASGKSRVVQMRTACNPRLRRALFHWGRSAIHCDQAARDHYYRLRSSGKSHGRATRGVVDRLLRIAVAALRSGTLYDPSRLGSTRLLQSGGQ
jgi:transposase